MDSLMYVTAEFLVFAVPATLVYVWYQGRQGRKDSLYSFMAVVLGLAASYTIMDQLHYTERPYILYDTIASGVSENSFPSQHTTTILSMVPPLLWVKRKKLAYFFLGAGLITGFARVYVGYHYPLDILGGAASALIGFTTVLLIHRHLDEYVEMLADFGDKLENTLFGPFRELYRKTRKRYI